jgi:H+/Cl- antiporter ClcA
MHVTLGSGAPGGRLTGTMSAAATSGLAIFDTLVIKQPGIGYTIVASAAGLQSVTSAPFTVF